MSLINCTYKVLEPLKNSLEWNQSLLSLQNKLILNEIEYDESIINGLKIDLVEFNQDLFNKPKSLIPSSITDNPFIHLLFLQCDVSFTYTLVLQLSYDISMNRTMNCINQLLSSRFVIG